MCILCVIQKWSRRLATMLPWLVIPLIGLWGLSQMLPPAYRFEVTSPRLACIFVLLITLFWYEVLMPRLSAWRVRRNARLREKKRIEALELQKLRKTATRRCRNCLTPYRDQNPGGGKFMCSYCGHISKRPVLDLPLPPGLDISNMGIIKDLFGKGGKILNKRVWSDNGSFCPDWLDQGSWAVASSFTEKSAYSRNNAIGIFGGDEECIDENSHSCAYLFPRIWTTLLKCMRLLWRKLFQDSSREDASDANKGMLTKRGENSEQYQESRAEKARRKAEEKKQARLEKELLEEEERKQREEVARLVEERRRLRDEKVEAENRARGSCMREKDRKEADKRRHEKKKEKDRMSSKSNSDAEEVDNKPSRENGRKEGSDCKAENDRKDHGVESVNAVKGSPMKNFGRGNAGNPYLDQMRGTLLSSSKAFTGGSFFGKVSRTPSVSKDKPNGSLNHTQVSVNKREICPTECDSTKMSLNVDHKGTNCLVSTDPQHKTAPKSWQQLFSPFPVSGPSNSNVIGRPIMRPQAEVQNSQPSSQSSSPPTYDNPIEFAFSFAFTLPNFSSGSISNSSGYPAAIPHLGVASHDVLFPEEPELFEDPCYVPDPVSLLGPVSESLDNFQLDMGTGFSPDGTKNYHSLNNASVLLDTNRQPHIDSSFTRLIVADEKQRSPAHLPTSPKGQGVHPFPAGDLDVNEKGMWQMWNSPALVPDGLAYACGRGNWTEPVNRGRSYQDVHSNLVPQKTMASLFTKDDHLVSGTHSPQKIFPGTTFGSLVTGANDDLTLRRTYALPLSAGEDHFPINPVEDTSQKMRVYGSPSRTATDHSFDASPANCWSKNERAMQNYGEGTGNSSVLMPHQMYSLFGRPNENRK